MRQNPSLVILSIAACLACSSTASTQRADASKPVPAVAPSSAGKPAIVPTPDFRRLFIEVAKTVRPSVVAVTSVSTVEAGGPGGGEGNPFDFFFRGFPRPEGKQKRQGIGSGVVIDARGYILTNNHVVEDADELKVVFSDDTEVPAEVVGTDPKTDVAVIKLKANGHKLPELRPVSLGDSDKLEVGEWVMAVGSPFGLKQTVSAGIVSAVGRGNVGITDYEDFIQTDAAINPGNSGGPLVNLNGALVGLNTAIASRSGGSQGVGFAIPINMAKVVMRQLMDSGQVVRGYLGVYIADLHEDLAKSFGYSGRGGVLVQDVSDGSPGAKAGLKAGDIILERDGKAVADVVTFRNAIAATAPGTKVGLTVFREGKKQQLSVKLEALPGEPSASAKPGKVGAEQGGRGLAISDLTPELRQRLGVESGQGAVVVRVAPDSAADRAGLRPGDLLQQIGSATVKNAKEAEQAFAKAKPDQTLRLRIVREGHGMFVLLTPLAK